MDGLFTLPAERYERGSVLLTSNLPFSQGEGIFRDPLTCPACLHHPVPQSAKRNPPLTEDNPDKSGPNGRGCTCLQSLVAFGLPRGD